MKSRRLTVSIPEADYLLIEELAHASRPQSSLNRVICEAIVMYLEQKSNQALLPLDRPRGTKESKSLIG